MVYKVYPLLNDFENLSRLRVESSNHANSFDYSNIVVNKPWGYEYLWFQNETVAIWFLYLNPGEKTSMHCHAKKRTSLIVLKGEVECTTLENRYTLSPLETVVLEPCVFHSSKCTSSEGVILIEIETPPMKGDLVRMHDAYGRQQSAYEKSNEYSTEFEKYIYKPLLSDESNRWTHESITSYISSDLSKENIPDSSLSIPISQALSLDKIVFQEIGEAKQMSDIPYDRINSNEKDKFLIFKFS